MTPEEIAHQKKVVTLFKKQFPDTYILVVHNIKTDDPYYIYERLVKFLPFTLETLESTI